MSDEAYTNLDLDTADELLVAAGHPAIAKALRHQTQGNRNLIQGQWGTQVVSAFEHILEVQVVQALASVQQTLDVQHELVQQILVSQKNSERIAQDALTVSKAGAARLGKLEKDMRTQDKRHGKQIAALQQLYEARRGERTTERAERDAQLAEVRRLYEAEHARLEMLEALVAKLDGGGDDDPT